ncbi:MAG: helix-turn-helix transcriptional regulator [Chthoniobacteraceae bacterium]|nr:helix-turn-helix transcriptional regulator [Chthoniobacteraceae bacterium]
MTSISSRPVRNVLGPRIRQLRESKGWSQADMARRLQLMGWDVERTVLTKIELRRRCIADYELMAIVQVLEIPLSEFQMPKKTDLRGFFLK